MISVVTQFFLGKMIGYLTSRGKYSAFPRRPQDLINPVSSILGFRASNLLPPERGFYHLSIMATLLEMILLVPTSLLECARSRCRW